MRAEISDALRARAAEHAVTVRLRTAVIDVGRSHGVHAARLAEIDTPGAKPRFSEEAVAADIVAVSGGWSPSVHLTSHLGVKPVWRERHRRLRAGRVACAHRSRPAP